MRSFCNCSQYYSRTFDGTVINYCGRTLKCDTSRTMWLGNARRTTECRNYSVAKIEKILLFSRRNLMLIFFNFRFSIDEHLFILNVAFFPRRNNDVSTFHHHYNCYCWYRQFVDLKNSRKAIRNNFFVIYALFCYPRPQILAIKISQHLS